MDVLEHLIGSPLAFGRVAFPPLMHFPAEAQACHAKTEEAASPGLDGRAEDGGSSSLK